jgi:hypothetical protein
MTSLTASSCCLYILTSNTNLNPDSHGLVDLLYSLLVLPLYLDQHVPVTKTNLNPNSHSLVDLFDSLLVLPLNLCQSVPVLIPLTQRLVPLPDSLYNNPL